MSLSIIPYQPLPFGLEPNCTLPCADWMQKIERGDVTSVQFNYGACGDTGTLIRNGDFADGSTWWTENGIWTYSSGIATSPVSGTGYIEQAVTTTGLTYVELTFSVTVNNGNLILSTDGGYLQVISSTGRYTFIIPVSGTVTFNFFFNSLSGLGGNLSNIVMRPVNTRVRMDVIDLDGNTVATVPTSWFNYNDGFLTANIEDWDSLALSDGCYKLAVYDPCDCSQFGFMGDNFEMYNQFIFVAGTGSVLGGSMASVVSSTPDQTQVRSRALLCPDVSYDFEYTVTGLDGANGDYFQLRIGSTNGTQRTVDGTYTETLTTSFTGNIQVRYIFNHGTGGSLNISISDFSMSASEPIVSYTSEPFNLKDDHKCTVLIEACGVGNEFNFGFRDTGFKPIIRLEGTYRTSNYPTTRTDYEYSNGTKVVPYMRTRQAKTLLFGAVEYVHDWARLWLGLTNLYIDGVLKFCEDSEPPTVSFEEDIDFGIVTYTFSNKTELTEKRSCTTLPNKACGEGFALSIYSTGGFVLDRPVLATQVNILRFG